MNINWNARITHKSWWIGIISLIILLSQQFGFDLTIYIPKNYADIINTIFAILVALGVTVDTSTPTISDVTVQDIVPINNTESLASSKINVDNPDNIQEVGQEVNHISANIPQ